MSKKKQKVEFRYYEIPNNEMVLALLGEEWRRRYCHEGTGYVTLDNQSCPFEPNMVVIIPPNLPHTTNSEMGTQSYWEWMYFDIGKCLNNIYKEMQTKLTTAASSGDLSTLPDILLMQDNAFQKNAMMRLNIISTPFARAITLILRNSMYQRDKNHACILI